MRVGDIVEVDGVKGRVLSSSDISFLDYKPIGYKGIGKYIGFIKPMSGWSQRKFVGLRRFNDIIIKKSRLF